MSLQFIDHSKPFTDASRRRIRRHAAKGHNAGRTINRASKALTLRHRPGDLFEADIRARTDTSPCALVGNNLGCDFPPYVSPQFQPLMRRCVWIFTQPLVTTNLGKIVERGSLSVAPMWIEMMFVDKGCEYPGRPARNVALTRRRLPHRRGRVPDRHQQHVPKGEPRRGLPALWRGVAHDQREALYG